MNKELMIIKFSEIDDDEISVVTEFPNGGIQVNLMFELCRKGIQGLMETCYKFAEARGISREETEDMMFGGPIEELPE